MPEEIKVETTLAPSGTEEQHATQAETEQPEQQETQPKVFTQEQVEKLVTRRLERDRTKQREQWEAERVENDRQARLSALEKSKEREQALERERDSYKDELDKERRTYALERQLVGKVVNVADALILIKPDDLKEDGSLDVDAFLEARPYLKPPEPEPSNSRLSGMNGRSVTPTDKSQINDFIRSAARR